MKFKTGTMVKTNAATVPTRYRGRKATVVGTQPSGRGHRLLLSFGARRAAPLAVPESQVVAFN